MMAREPPIGVPRARDVYEPRRHPHADVYFAVLAASTETVVRAAREEGDGN